MIIANANFIYFKTRFVINSEDCKFILYFLLKKIKKKNFDKKNPEGFNFYLAIGQKY